MDNKKLYALTDEQVVATKSALRFELARINELIGRFTEPDTIFAQGKDADDALIALSTPIEPVEQVDPFAPDWSTAPEQAKYHAVDHNSSGFWYSREPHVHETDSVWDIPSDDYGENYVESDFILNWRESLRKRPE